jgi:hypothetical protein
MAAGEHQALRAVKRLILMHRKPVRLRSRQRASSQINCPTWMQENWTK